MILVDSPVPALFFSEFEIPIFCLIAGALRRLSAFVSQTVLAFAYTWFASSPHGSLHINFTFLGNTSDDVSIRIFSIYIYCRVLKEISKDPICLQFETSLLFLWPGFSFRSASPHYTVLNVTYLTSRKNILLRFTTENQKNHRKKNNLFHHGVAHSCFHENVSLCEIKIHPGSSQNERGPDLESTCQSLPFYGCRYGC